MNDNKKEEKVWFYEVKQEGGEFGRNVFHRLNEQ